MSVKLGILGLGTVGTGTVQLLQDLVGRNSLLKEVEVYRVGVRSLDKPRTVQLPSEVITTDLEAIVNDPAVDVVVELMGGLEPARTLILKAIKNGKHVVTANKAAISRFGAEIFDAANAAGVYVMLEAAVGGGIPVIQPLKQSLSVNKISAVMGIVNGTTNYILTKMLHEGSDFHDVLADAQRLGYAEADPTADIDGLDAADKIAILASLGFDGRINREDVYCEGIRNVTKTDITYATKLGFVIKLLAIASSNIGKEQLSVRVHPTLIPESHPLANINGVYNAIVVEGEPIGQVMLFGPGAGAGATASAVCSDILHLVANLKTNTSKTNPLLACRHEQYCKITPISEVVTRFYTRFLSQDQAGVIGKIGTCFGKYAVSLESIVQTGFHAGLAEIVVVTHDVREGDFRQALQEIEAMEAIHSIPSILRVL